jgi:hypothetical protein
MKAIMQYYPCQNRAVKHFVTKTKRFLLKLIRGDMNCWEKLVFALKLC